MAKKIHISNEDTTYCKNPQAGDGVSVDDIMHGGINPEEVCKTCTKNLTADNSANNKEEKNMEDNNGQINMVAFKHENGEWVKIASVECHVTHTTWRGFLKSMKGRATHIRGWKNGDKSKSSVLVPDSKGKWVKS